MWYGLLENGQLVAVQWFDSEPLIFDSLVPTLTLNPNIGLPTLLLQYLKSCHRGHEDPLSSDSVLLALLNVENVFDAVAV